MDERIDELNIGGLKLIQKTSGFRYGTDAVLLARFSSVHPGEKVLDFCTGSGIVPILLTQKEPRAEYYGLEILPEIADMAKRSVKLNGLEEKVHILAGDLKEANRYFPFQFDAITCNPPYRPLGKGKINPSDGKAVARHEIYCNLEDVIRMSARMLKFGGRMTMVHRADRLTDVFSLMRQYKIEPKRLQLVCPKIGQAPNLILVEGALGRGAELKILPPVSLYDENGTLLPQFAEKGMAGESC